MWADSHCHVPYEGVDDPDTVLAQARAAGVGRFVTVGTDAGQSRAALELAGRHPDVWATVGLHPHDASQGLAEVVALLDAHADDDRLVAVGECGLDYHYDHSPRDVQREVFAAQVAEATRRDLTLVIHSREAWDDTFGVLDAVGVPARTVFHCFTGGADEARRALDRGAFVSFSGIVSFRNAGDVREAAILCPSDRLLVETDTPFLAPVPHRGQSNRPAWVVDVGAAVAAARGEPVEAVAAATWAATAAAFALDP
jgi:TatD DNase family protein